MAAGTGFCVALILWAPTLSPSLGVLLVALATSTCLLVLWAERRGRGPTLRGVVIALAAVVIVAVLIAPRSSQDLWLYSMYGRTLAVHHVSPYTHVPADFPADPFLGHVARGWHHSPSVYGPLFVAYASLGALVAGDHLLVARLFHQLVAAGALTGILLLVWRRTQSPAALALVGLNPAIAVAALNGGHADLLVGFLILAAVLLAADDRLLPAGLLLGAAIAVKVTAALALLGLLVWLCRRRDVRMATRLALPAVAVPLIGYVAAGPDALRALEAGDNVGIISRASIWQLPLAKALDLSASSGPRLISLLATLTVAALATGLAWRTAGHRGPEQSALVATASYPLAASYTLPWYMGWGSLPLAALRPHSRLTALLVVEGGFLTAAYQLPHGLARVPWLPGGHPIVTYLAPTILLVAFVVIAASDRPERGSMASPRPDPAPSGTTA